MLMNVLASALLFLIIGPFKHVSSGETKEAGVSSSQVKDVYIAVNNTLELNCSINATVHNIHPTQLGWKHNSLTLVNFTHIVNNNTIQLRKNHTQCDDAGVYECGLFVSSKFQSVQKIVVIVGEKPKSISRDQFDVAVYGKPVREVIVKWPAVQANVTNELFVGRVPAGQVFNCKFNNTAQCRRTSEFQNEMLSCYIGMDVLGKLFHRNELLKAGCRGHLLSRCDRFCVKVLVKNSFGTSENTANWNLLRETKCPPPCNLTVSFVGHHLIASWQRPPVVANIRYFVKYYITPILTGKTSRAKHFDNSLINPNCTKCAWSIYPIIPFARYNFTAACMFDFVRGPDVQTQVRTKEAAPSEAPYSCEVKDRTRHEALVSWKAPLISTWNGKPNKFLVYYGDERVAVNTSLAKLQTGSDNRSATAEVTLKNLDPGKNYTVRVAMCTGGGCGNRSEPCFIRDSTEDDSNEKVPSPEETNSTGVITWVAIAIGAVVGIILVAFIVWLMWRKRSQRKERPSLSSVLTPLTGFHPYDSPIDESPSFCEDDQCYDIIDPIINRPLLANVDGPVANLPVTDI